MREYDCQSCGACCEFNSVPPGETAWVLSLPEKRQREIAERLAQDDGHRRVTRCLWLRDDGGGHYRCTHYNLRPPACRNFLEGSAECASFKTRAGRNFVLLTIEGTSNADRS